MTDLNGREIINYNTKTILFAAPVPLFVGFTITCCHLFAADVSGSAMNPARALGPSVVASKYKDQWVYWVGGFLGALFAGIIYEYILAPDASVQKLKNIFLGKSNDTECKPENPADKKSKDAFRPHVTPNNGENKTELQAISTEG